MPGALNLHKCRFYSKNKGRPHQSVSAGDPSEEEVVLRLCLLAAWQTVLGESGFTVAKAAVGTTPGFAFSIR